MRPDKPGQSGPDSEHQETAGIHPQPLMLQAFPQTFPFPRAGGKQPWVCWRFPALFTWLNNSPVARRHPTAGWRLISTESW